MRKEVEREIDYDDQIFYGIYRRQADSEKVSSPLLVQYHVCVINPKESSKIMTMVKTSFSHTSLALRHLKRIRKMTNGQLMIIICPYDECEEEELSKVIENYITGYSLDIVSIPMNTPKDKETNLEWSEKYWPLVWKGNPLIQELNELYSNFNKEEVDKYTHLVVKLSQEHQKVAAIFVDPKNGEIKAQVIDQRNDDDPIRHPIMEAIDQIAQNEVNRRAQKGQDDKAKNNYLCLNYNVYVSHEPCVMCSMALIHSRISQLVYKGQSPLTGGIDKSSGDKLMIHLSCTLNWKFEAFKTLDDTLEVPALDPSFNV